MDFLQDFQEGPGRGAREGARGNLLNRAAREGVLCFSNFLLTFSTNVVPEDNIERDELTFWLMHRTNEMFGDWQVLNSGVLKPAGSANEDRLGFGDPCQIVSVKSQIAIEEGGQQRGQIHAHILLEVAHTYRRAVEGNEGVGEGGRAIMGVHTNVLAMREYLNRRIHLMQIEPARKPRKVYVNSRLLTKGTDNSNKWLTLQYINKDSAEGGARNLRADEHNAANPEDSHTRQVLLNAAAEHVVEPDGVDPFRDSNEDVFEGVGGALSPLPSPPASPEAPRMVRTTRPAPALVAPGFVATTSAVNIGGKRFTRGRGPQRYGQ